MDRNTIIGIVLLFLIIVGYSIWMTPSKEEKEALRHKQDSILQVMQSQKIEDSLAQIKIKEQHIQDSINKTLQVKSGIITTSDESAITQAQRDKLGIFAGSITGPEKEYTIENDLYKIKVAARGGKIVSVQLKEFHTYDSLPLILFDPEKTNFGLTFFAMSRLINTNEMYFQPGQDTSMTVNGSSTRSFSMRLYADANDSAFDKNSYVEFLYTLKGNDYMMDFDINFVGMNKYVDAGTNFIDLAWNTEMLTSEKGVDRFNGPTIYYKYFQDEDVDFLSETKDAEKDLITKVKWIAFKQRFFTSTLIAKDQFLSAKIKTFTLKDDINPRYLRSAEAAINIPFKISEKTNVPMSFYFGPNKFKTLRKYRLDLERQIPLGWSFFLMAWINRYAVLPVFNLLEGFGWNYGIIILILTILLKIVLLPIAYKSYVSSAKMKFLKPDIDELGKKFPKKEDAMKKQQATMALYRQAGVNPMAGCIPMLLQFPILIAMFRFFPAAFELRQQAFLWADDLSSYDSILNLNFNIPFYGSHVSLFTLLMTISTIIYTKINQDLMSGGQQQMPGMKTMMYVMPIMFLGIFNNYASGLSYYYFLANVLTFGQMWLIRKFINEDKIRKQIDENKRKPPKKKSNWQKRLEDAAKSRGYKPAKR
jgi:YidC/Oxa1 family membrane protein insertase